jgi:hypothetical protein
VAEVWNASGMEVPFYRGWEWGSDNGMIRVIVKVVNGD